MLMRRCQQVICIITLIIFHSRGFCQEKKIIVKPYSIESTYEKLKKTYPFIIPIKPIISKKIKSKENIVYLKIGKTKLKADVYIPQSYQNKKFPSVILIHGGAWNSGSKENQRCMAQQLALNGFVSISISYRLSTEAPYPAAVSDIKSAIKWARKNAKKYHINPEKLAILGASAGAQLATLVGVTPNSSIYNNSSLFSDDVQAIINIDGIVSFIHPEAQESDSAGMWLGGLEDENPKNWKEASPLEYVNEKSPPTLFINSTQPRFHAGRDDMITILNKYNIYNEIHTIPDTPHSFWLMHPWFETTINFTVSFLNKVLKNDN